MRTFPSDEALVAAYWRRLARSIDWADTGKRGKSSSVKLQAGSGVRQHLAASRNGKRAIPTRRTPASRLRSGGHIRRKIATAIAG